MRNPVLTIFYQFDPWVPTIGGIQTLILSFIKYASPEFKLRLVGINSAPKLDSRKIGQWNLAELYGREILFLPLFHLPDDDVRHTIPTSLKYTLALMRRRLSSDFMHFYRLEPTLASFSWEGEKTLIVQNDIFKQVAAKDDQKAILWQRFPQAYFLLERLLVRQFDHILSCNINSIKFYQEYYPKIANRVSYFKNVFDGDVFYPLPAQEREQTRKRLAQDLNLSEDVRFVIFAGRLHPQKDPLLLIRSIAALNDPLIHLLIAGVGELESAVRAEIQQLGLSHQISMLGVVHQPELATLYQISDAFILTSLYEGLPLAVLEALACGTPIVTSPSGDLPQLLNDRGGLIYYERSAESVADAIKQVLAHSVKFSALACVQTVKDYSAQAVIGQIYDQMLATWKQKILPS